MAGQAAQPIQPVRHAVRNVALCLGALAAVCLAIHRLLPLPEIPEVSAKLAYFTRHKDEFDTIFVGSSRVYRGIIPRAFDPVAGTKSFNFGIDGMMAPESYFLLEKILAEKPARLRWVFVELTTLWSAVTPGRLSTMRDVYWHDWPRTAAICRSIWDSGSGKKGLRKKGWPARFQNTCALLASHLQLCLKNYANIGRGAGLLAAESGATPEELEKNLGPPREGFSQMGGRSAVLQGEQLENYNRMLSSAATSKPRQEGSNPAFCNSTGRAIARVRGTGAVPLFVIAPWPDVPRNFFPDPKKAPPVFAFNDPSSAPELFRTDRRVDEGHLNRAGAETFSRLLAEQFVRLRDAAPTAGK